MGDILTVKDMMNGVLMHADQSENLIYVTHLLYNNNANAVIIRENGVPKGMITSKDIIRALMEIDKHPENIIAHEFMNKNIISVDHQDDINEARKMMVENGLRKLPVKRNVDIIGLLIMEDFVKDLSWYRR